MITLTIVFAVLTANSVVRGFSTEEASSLGAGLRLAPVDLSCELKTKLIQKQSMYIDDLKALVDLQNEEIKLLKN